MLFYFFSHAILRNPYTTLGINQTFRRIDKNIFLFDMTSANVSLNCKVKHCNFFLKIYTVIQLSFQIMIGAFLGLRSESNQALLYHIQCIPRHFYRNTSQRSVALEPKPCITEQNTVQLKGLTSFSTAGSSSL